MRNGVVLAVQKTYDAASHLVHSQWTSTKQCDRKMQAVTAFMLGFVSEISVTVSTLSFLRKARSQFASQHIVKPRRS